MPPADPSSALRAAIDERFFAPLRRPRTRRVGVELEMPIWNLAPGAPNDFAAIHGRHPDFFRAEFNYACMLRDEGKIPEAMEIIGRIASEHPEYAFAQAVLVQAALEAKDLAKAERIVGGYRPPVRMHPLEYRAWLRAVLAFREAAHDEIGAANTQDAIERIESDFGLPQ
jgi:hypothetical protein